MSDETQGGTVEFVPPTPEAVREAIRRMEGDVAREQRRHRDLFRVRPTCDCSNCIVIGG